MFLLCYSFHPRRALLKPFISVSLKFHVFSNYVYTELTYVFKSKRPKREEIGNLNTKKNRNVLPCLMHYLVPFKCHITLIMSF